MEVIISTVKHRDQDYDTAGNWAWEPGETLTIQVSRLPDERYEFLVALHELVEAYLCKAAGVSTEAVTRFDLAWEQVRRDSPSAASAEALAGISEPGDDPTCPYRLEHKRATMVEQLAAEWLEVDWTAYEAAIEALER